MIKSKQLFLLLILAGVLNCLEGNNVAEKITGQGHSDLIGDQYKVITYTGPEKGAGTKSNIYVVLYGENGETQEKELQLDPTNKDAFSAGKTDIFRLLASEQIGRINKIQIRTDGTGEEPSWFLNEVDVVDPKK